MWKIDSLYPRFSRFCCLTVVLNLFGPKNPPAISSQDGWGLNRSGRSASHRFSRYVFYKRFYSVNLHIISYHMSFKISHLHPIFQWFSSHFPWISHGFPMDFPWISHGFPIDFPTSHVDLCHVPLGIPDPYQSARFKGRPNGLGPGHMLETLSLISTKLV